MPALRVFCYDYGRSSNRKKTHKLVWWLADYDLRGIAKYSFILRCVQLVVLIPTFVELVRTSINTRRLFIPSSLPCRMRQLSMIVWFFCLSSLFTVLFSMVLDIQIFRVSSRGSPTQVEERRSLQWLCALKLIPFSALRVVTVILAMCTLSILERFCDPILLQSSPCSSFENVADPDVVNKISTDDLIHLCPKSTKELIAILAYTHISELSVVGFIALWVFYGNLQKQLQWWKITTRSWSMYLRRPQYHRSTALTSDITASSSSAWWHGLCRCCCACTSVFTCCLFGGGEVFRSSTSNDSSLSDISIILADFFNTGSNLDITPSDVFVGISALSIEQRLQKEDRLKELRCEIEQSKAFRASTGAAKHRTTGNIDDDDSFDNPVFATDVEHGSRAVLTIRPFATGSFDDSIIQRSVENTNSDDEDTSDDDDSDQRETAFTSSSVQVVQDLQMCRIDSHVFFKVTTRRRLDFTKDLDRLIIHDGTHYMKYALAVYGHILYLAQNPCSAPCCLMTGFLTCRGKSYCDKLDEDILNEPIQVVGDGMFGCNELGFLHTAGLHHTDLAYASFKTGIKACPYVIAVDNEKKSVVLVIKGTFSLESLVADLNVRPELLNIHADICDVFAEPSMANEYCHSGMLNCAVYLFKELERHKTLDRLLLGENARLTGYSLVITGHSLGAGCAAVLAIMLRNKFPLLRCLCFAPPGCVLSLSAAQDRNISSFVLDADLVPRLSVHSVVGLRNDVLDMIARVSVPKHKVVAPGADTNPNFAHRRESIPLSTYYGQVLAFREHQDKLKIDSIIPDVKLYPPGRLIHLIKNRAPVTSYRRHRATYIPVWAENDDFAEILLTKSSLTLSDHDPEHYLRYLTSVLLDISLQE